MSQRQLNVNVDSLIKVKNPQGGYDIVYPITRAENVKIGGTKSLAQKIREVENAIAAKISSSAINQANGVAGLDENGLIPARLIPTEFKEIHMVEDIAGRDEMGDLFVGKTVYVKDATGDETVNRGGAYYIWDGLAWLKTSESESLDVVLNWDAIEGKPTTLDGYGITDAVHSDEVSTVAEANKLLKLNAEAKLEADVAGNADTASKLKEAVNIKVEGDVVEANVEFDGSKEIIIPVALKNTGVSAGTYVKVEINDKGQVVGTGVLAPEDIPGLDWTKIVSGKPTTLAGYGITDAVNKEGDTMVGPLTLHGDPTEALHAATKQYVDSVVQGLDVKSSVRVATTGDISLAGLIEVDGVTLKAGDRVLVKEQTDARQNGIYVVQEGPWTRAIDADSSAKVSSGLFTFVEEGNTNSDSGFVLITDTDIVLNVTELRFSQFSGAGQIIAGTGLAKDGNTIYLATSGVEAGTYTKVTVDAQGRVTVGGKLEVADLPEISWDLLQGKPASSVQEIDEAVAKAHEHANKDILDKVSEVEGRIAHNGRTLAYQDEVVISATTSEEPGNLSVGGMWFQIVE